MPSPFTNITKFVNVIKSGFGGGGGGDDENGIVEMSCGVRWSGEE